MAVNLATSSDYLKRTTSLLPASGDSTVCFWVKYGAISASPNYQTSYVILDAPGTYVQYAGMFASNPGNQNFLEVTGPLQVSTYPPTIVLASTWYHLAWVQSGTTQLFYVNATLIGSQTLNRAAFTNGDEYLGNDTFSDGNLALAYCREWTAALTQPQIQAEMSASAAVYATNLYMDCPLVSDLLDDSGGGHDWTQQGSGSFVNGPFPPVYYDITATPYSQLVSQATFNGGSHGFAANEVYFRYVASAQTALGGYTNSGGTFTPKSFIYQTVVATELHHVTGAFGWWYLLDAGTYWIKVIRNGGGASNFDFTATNNVHPLNPTLPAGSIVVNDDESGFKATAWQTDGTFLGVMTDVPAGETGDGLSNGSQLWTDRFAALGAANSMARFSTSNTYLSSVSPTPAISGFPIVAHDDSQFYVLNRTTGVIASVTQGGTLTNAVATLSTGPYSAMGVNPDGTIAYWAQGNSSNSHAIHRHDLVNDVPLSDLYVIPAFTGGATGRIALTAFNLNPGEILVLSNGNVVTWYRDDTNDETRLLQIDPAGVLVTSKTYTGVDQYIDHIHYAPDNPDGIHIWFFTNGIDDTGRIGHLTLSSGVLDTFFDTDLFSAGINKTGTDMIGPSASCTMLTIVYLGGGGTTGALQVVKATVPGGAGQAFDFTASGTGVDPTFTLHDTELITFSDLDPGTDYSVHETVPDSWSVSYEVSNGSSIDNLLIEAGEVTTVTVTNTSAGGGLGIPVEYVIRRERWWPHISSEQFRQFFSMLQVDLYAGNGITTGQGEDPLLEVDWSDDGGHTWSSIHFVHTGKIGAYRQRAILRRMGYSRDRVYRIAVSDPNQWVIVNGYLQAVLGTS